MVSVRFRTGSEAIKLWAKGRFLWRVKGRRRTVGRAEAYDKPPEGYGRCPGR